MKKLSVRSMIVTITSIVPFLCASLASAEPVTKSPGGYFEFHIDPWISLHHFAYHFAREEQPNLDLRGRLPLTEEDRQVLSPEVRSACASLHTAYRPYIEGHLLFDSKTRGLTKTLQNGPEALEDVAVRSALKTCMPIYDEFFWQRHRMAAKRFVERLEVQLQTHETTMATQLAEVLEGSWPDTPIRVDVTPYASWSGAYTDGPPANITISSLDEDVSGAYAFEILFHESSHTASFQESIIASADNALKSTGLESDRFWHFVLFFVTGRIAFDVLNDPDYVPYSKATGLTESDSSAEYYEALEETWNSGNSLRERVLSAAQRVVENRQ